MMSKEGEENAREGVKDATRSRVRFNLTERGQHLQEQLYTDRVACETFNSRELRTLKTAGRARRVVLFPALPPSQNG